MRITSYNRRTMPVKNKGRKEQSWERKTTLTISSHDNEGAMAMKEQWRAVEERGKAETPLELV